MTKNLDALAAKAVDALAALKGQKTANAAAIELAFRTSALTTFGFIAAGGKAVDLAALNLAAGVGYGSDAAVGYHAQTGQYLTLPVGEWEKAQPKAQTVQTLIRKVGQKKAKPILAKAETQADAHARLLKAVPVKAFDMDATLAEAFALLQQVEEYRVKGNALSAEGAAVVNDIDAALCNIKPVATPVIQIVREKAAVSA